MVQTINGYLGGTGSSPYAAHADHTHEDKVDKTVGLKAVKKTIKVADWNDSAADVPFTEGTYIGYEVEAASISAATSAVLVFSEVGTNKLTFGCTNTPAANIDVYILYL